MCSIAIIIVLAAIAAIVHIMVLVDVVTAIPMMSVIRVILTRGSADDFRASQINTHTTQTVKRPIMFATLE